MKLYITRHGQTEWNTQKRMQGWKDSSLTAKGEEDAAALGRRLESVEFNCIYSSTSGRAMRTAELIRGSRDIPILPVDRLREINLGELEGRTVNEFMEEDEEGYRNFFERPHLYVAKSGENYFQVRERIEAVLKEIAGENPEGNVLVVTHSVIVKTILSIYKGLPVEELWSPPFIHATSLSIVEIKDGRPEVLMDADVSHAPLD